MRSAEWHLVLSAPAPSEGRHAAHIPGRDRFCVLREIGTGIFIALTAGLVALAFRMVVTGDA